MDSGLTKSVAKRNVGKMVKVWSKVRSQNVHSSKSVMCRMKLLWTSFASLIIIDSMCNWWNLLMGAMAQTPTLIN